MHSCTPFGSYPTLLLISARLWSVVCSLSRHQHCFGILTSCLCSVCFCLCFCMSLPVFRCSCSTSFFISPLSSCHSLPSRSLFPLLHHHPLSIPLCILFSTTLSTTLSIHLLFSLLFSPLVGPLLSPPPSLLHVCLFLNHSLPDGPRRAQM